MALYDHSRDAAGSRFPLSRFGGGYLWLLLAALVAIVLVMSMTPVTTPPVGDAPAVTPVIPPPTTTP
jgi:hypothetical protein